MLSVILKTEIIIFHSKDLLSYAVRFLEGEARFAALFLKLLSTGKTEDLELAARDESMRQELYRKYGI